MKMLADVFGKQQQLVIAYEGIVRNNGLGLPVVSIHNIRTQALLKRTAHHAIEEYIEFYEDPSPEEYVDILHFLVELMIHSGVRPEHILGSRGMKQWGDLPELMFEATAEFPPLSVREAVFTGIFTLERAMMLLKNNPWKQTHRTVDEKKYRERLCYAFLAYLNVATTINMSAEELHSAYVAKFEKNQQRMKESY